MTNIQLIKADDATVRTGERQASALWNDVTYSELISS